MLFSTSSLARGSERAKRKAKAGRARESGLNLENDTEKETRKERPRNRPEGRGNGKRDSEDSKE